MKICLKCNRGLFDRDAKCDQCGCTDIMDKTIYTHLYNKFKKASPKEQDNLRQTDEYAIICKYKFIIDAKNTAEMRKAQSISDKEKAKVLEEKSKAEFAKMQQRAKLREIEKNQKEAEQCIPRCPTCGSTNVEPLSHLRKLGGLLTIGLASKSVGKTYRCLNCKYYW